MPIQQACAWMVSSIQKGRLYQEDAAHYIEKNFAGLTYINDSGGLAIDKKLLRAFNAATKETVVWEKYEKCWRLREPYDSPGRAQD